MNLILIYYIYINSLTLQRNSLKKILEKLILKLLAYFALIFVFIYICMYWKFYSIFSYALFHFEISTSKSIVSAIFICFKVFYVNLEKKYYLSNFVIYHINYVASFIQDFLAFTFVLSLSLIIYFQNEINIKVFLLVAIFSLTYCLAYTFLNIKNEIKYHI